MERKEFFIKPLTVLALIIIFTITLFLANRGIYLLLLALSFALVLIMNRSGAKKFLSFYLGLILIIFLLGKLYGISKFAGVFIGIFLIMLRLFPVWGLSSVMLSFNTQEIMNSLRKVGISNNIAIGVAVFFRFLPEYFIYLGQIREGAVVRGIGPSIRRPIESLETVLVPMIYKAFETGENITAALMTKGIEYKGKKTFYRNIDLGYRDYIILLFSLLLLAGGIWTKL